MRTNKDKTPAAVGVTNGVFAVFAGFGRMLAEMIRQIFR